MNTMTQAFGKTFGFDKTFDFDKASALYKATQGQAGLGSVMKGVTAVAKTNQTAGIEWTDFARQSLAEGTATMKKLAAARTPQAAFEIQTAYLKGSYERLVAQTQTMRDLYAGLAGTMKPQGTGAKLPATV